MKFAHLITRAGWWLCIFLTGTAALRAQSASGPQQGDVPREFAQVLLMYRSGEFRIGRMAENLPAADQLAAGSRVIGSVVRRDGSESAIAVREAVAEARQPFEARLRAAGWTERPPPDQPQRGFLPPYAQDSQRGFCWPETDAQLSVNVRRGPNGGSYIVLSYYAPGEGRRCAVAPPSEPFYTVLQSMMPSLRPPDGTEVTGGGGGGGGGDEYETRSSVASPYKPAELIRHFQPQLREQGWSVTEQLNGKDMAIVSARKKRDSGPDLLLWVSAMRENAEQVRLSMRIIARAGSR